MNGSAALTCCLAGAVAVAGAALADALRRGPDPVVAASQVRVRPPPPDHDAAKAALARAVAEDTPLPVGAAEEYPAAAVTDEAGAEVASGPMETVLYGGSGAASPIVATALKLFAHRLDLTRDLALGDRVRLAWRKSADGAPVLDYAEVEGARGAARFYRVEETGDEADAFADETGASVRRLLLRTPILHPRLTSAFGMRFHPLLGYTRMHRGVDFGAPVGAAVLAAGDGVVAAAGWAGGYGRRVRLRHAGGYETVYAHLSAWAPGLTVGAHVRQGQVIGWTGESGLASGPHLHFEVLKNGEAVDPAGAAPPAPAPSPARLAAFETRRRAIEAVLASAAPPKAAR
ncbi:hypothetical protein C5708_00145 [Caulobacter sp. CCUG 60055]|uniref:M23 family metallopeptidase n=1 Tax=Caulobacter sp. CCUG 60055 TaxID=2100090 RepID=UPI001FA7584D|nr:M23 family metallopeptidase [Caulobacter sp. CCUG 60055]MCI3178656.1 hypothetical protein [Caulobacter sp. CCUG 60055]